MNISEILKKYNGGLLRGAPAKLADNLGKTRSTISRIIDGEMKLPEALAPKMAKALGVTVPELETALRSRNQVAHGTAEAGPSGQYGHSLPEVPTTDIPVIGFISSEYFTTCSFEDNYNATEVLTVMTTPGVKLKAIKVVGDVMEPECKDGGHLLVAPGSICEDGILSIVKIDGQYTAKNLYIRGNKAILDSENPKYKRREVPLKDLQIIGPVPYDCRKKAPKPFKK